MFLAPSVSACFVVYKSLRQLKGKTIVPFNLGSPPNAKFEYPLEFFGTIEPSVIVAD